MNDVDQSVLSRASVENDQAVVQQWLGSLEAALRDRRTRAVAALFAPDSHWRDLLAFTWSLTPHSGADQIAAAMARLQAVTQAHGFAIARNRTAPRRVRRLGIDVIEALFDFETAVGRGSGVLRLPVDKPSQAWVLSTSLEELKGFEEKTGARRPTGEEYAHNFGGDNWLDERTKTQAYLDRDPTVLVVGGGQAGLGIAARLGQLNVDTLVVDRHERIGDNWR